MSEFRKWLASEWKEREEAKQNHMRNSSKNVRRCKNKQKPLE